MARDIQTSLTKQEALIIICAKKKKVYTSMDWVIISSPVNCACGHTATYNYSLSSHP